MDRKLPSLIALLAGVLAAPNLAWPGNLQATVVDDDGDPVADAVVYAVPVGGDGGAAIVDDRDGGIAVADVPQGALSRLGARRFLEFRIARQQTGRIRQIFGPAAFRAPAAIVQTQGDRRIQGGAIDPALAAGDNLRDSHGNRSGFS